MNIYNKIVKKLDQFAEKVERVFNDLDNFFDGEPAKKTTRESSDKAKSKKTEAKRSSLYDERTEELIDIALTDGVLTVKEKQVLLRNAKEKGIDLDELEMVLEARLAEINKVEEEVRQLSKAAKQTAVRRCPTCGELLDGWYMRCRTCGARFAGGENMFVEKLRVDLMEAIKKLDSEFVIKGTDRYKSIKESTIIDFIRAAPVPNTVDDCIATLNYCSPSALSLQDGTSPVWRDYYLTVLNRLETASLGDKELDQIVELYKRNLGKTSMSMRFKIAYLRIPYVYRVNIVVLAVLVPLLILLFTFIYYVEKNNLF